MKTVPDHEDEVHDVVGFKDPAQNVITAVMQLSGVVAQELVWKIKGIVRAAHKNEAFLNPDEDGIARAQVFEEGYVFMLEKPFNGYPSDRYLMDFYDVNEQGVCSRMHVHTGTRFVRIITGADTSLRISSFSPMLLNSTLDFSLKQEVDEMPGMPDGHRRNRHSVIVPPNSVVDMQIPAGVSHQFNADGQNAVIDSVHPEESIEVFRENMRRPNMMAQTVFLTPDKPKSGDCVIGYVDSFIRQQELAAISRRDWLAMAAGFVVMGAATAFGFSAIEKREIANFRRNYDTVELKFNPASQINMADAYGASEIINPQAIYMPKGIYDIAKSKPHLLQDGDYAAWVASKTILRKTDGKAESEQVIFEYLVAGEGKFQTKSVTTTNFDFEVTSLLQKMAQAHSSQHLSRINSVS